MHIEQERNNPREGLLIVLNGIEMSERLQELRKVMNF